jgi:hypothetical protein
VQLLIADSENNVHFGRGTLLFIIGRGCPRQAAEKASLTTGM